MAVAFKEWAIVCEALGSGRQVIILRKGGIAEGREGFRFKHASFLLFPTFFHEQMEKTVLPPGSPIPEAVTGDPSLIGIGLRADVVWADLITDRQIALGLAPFHILKPEVVEERFEYDEVKGIHVAVVRVSRLEQPQQFPDAPRYGGCRSWLEVPEAEEGSTPVLSDEAFAGRLSELRAAGVPVPER